MLPIMVVAPFSVAMVMLSINLREPLANFSNQYTPSGPFQMMVQEFSMIVLKRLELSSPMSRLIKWAGIPELRVAVPVCG